MVQRFSKGRQFFTNIGPLFAIFVYFPKMSEDPRIFSKGRLEELEVSGNLLTSL